MHEGEEVTGGTRQRLIHQIQWSRTVMLHTVIFVRFFGVQPNGRILKLGSVFPKLARFGQMMRDGVDRASSFDALISWFEPTPSLKMPIFFT